MLAATSCGRSGVQIRCKRVYVSSAAATITNPFYLFDSYLLIRKGFTHADGDISVLLQG
uniref:Uncharacterized protein n=1 Tax=Hyaloperonospora arabidopsidis (strain Emoy2) TaxID=559515 RepID=M4C1W5_HYAAE